jgi:hypothetical protein
LAWGSAVIVINISSAPGVTTVVGVSSVVCVSAVTDVPSFLAFMLLCGVLLLLGPSVVDIRYIPNISTIVGGPPKMTNFQFFSSKRS